jgi:adenosylcobinamide amidohydrolase
VYCCFEVRNSDLPLGVDPETIITRFSNSLGVGTAVATLTSADIGAFCSRFAEEQGVVAFALATSGFANALRVGELGSNPVRAYMPDTINIACWVNRTLSFEARLEALSIITQARTLAMLEAGIESSDGTGIATGTGTDCITLFTLHEDVTNGFGPTATQSIAYSGMHTTVGRVLGKAVRDVMNTATARVAKVVPAFGRQ